MCEICRKKRLTSYGNERGEETGMVGRAEHANWSASLPPESGTGKGLCREEEPQGNPARPQEERKPGSSDPGRKPPPHLSYWEELALRTLLTSLEVRGRLRSACDVLERGLRGGLVSYLVAVIKHLTKVT